MRLLKHKVIICLSALAVIGGLLMPAAASAQRVTTADSQGSQTSCGGKNQPYCTGSEGTGKYQCGSGSDAVKTTIDFGCRGKSCVNNCSAVMDLTFAIIRFLSDGVGLVVVASIIVGGIQYSTSKGDPKASEMAQKRLQSSVIALLIFIFAYAILNYVIPAGFFS